MNNQETKRLPQVGEIVLSKSLKLQRVVTAIDGQTVTLSAIKSKVYTSFFDRLSFDFNKKMSLDDFYFGYIFKKEVINESLVVSSQEMEGVFSKLGEMYQNIDTQERVMLGLNHTDENGENKVELHSFDQMVEGEYLRYCISEDYFQANFKSIEKKPKYKTPLSISF